MLEIRSNGKVEIYEKEGKVYKKTVINGDNKEISYITDRPDDFKRFEYFINLINERFDLKEARKEAFRRFP